MSLQDAFNYEKDKNPDGYRAEKVNDNVLVTNFCHGGYQKQCAYYDFLTRTVAIFVSGSENDRILTFAEMDPEVLELHREKLIALGGRPQPLPGARRPADNPPHRAWRA